MIGPYSEALFSGLTFLGLQLYLPAIKLHQKKKTTVGHDVRIMLAGAIFGIATTVRSNGLLSGALFMFDAVSIAWTLRLQGWDIYHIRRLIVICIGGSLTGLGALAPQYHAFLKYCSQAPNTGNRPWCQWWIPSIYNWVQQQYW